MKRLIKYVDEIDYKKVKYGSPFRNANYILIGEINV